MKKKNKIIILSILIISSISCFLLVCFVTLYTFLLAASDPFSTEEPIETITLNEEQLETCRKLLAINEGLQIEGEYYLYTPGFLDDSLECRLRVRANAVEDIFDLTIIDPHLSDAQEIAPGRYLQLTIKKLEPGLFSIEGFWFET